MGHLLIAIHFDTLEIIQSQGSIAIFILWGEQMSKKVQTEPELQLKGFN